MNEAKEDNDFYGTDDELLNKLKGKYNDITEYLQKEKRKLLTQNKNNIKKHYLITLKILT